MDLVTQVLHMALVAVLALSVGMYLLLLVSFTVGIRRMLWLDTPSDPGHRVNPAAPGVTIIKPCAGADDDLEGCLESYCKQDYPNLQILLGVRNRDDLAYPTLRAVAARHPELQIEVVLTEGGHCKSPKVASIEMMLPKARHPILWLSDSNTLVHPDTLSLMVQELHQPRVGIVVSPIVAVGERTAGSWLDSLSVNSYSWLGSLTIYVLLDRVAALGKSVVVRRADLEAVGLAKMGNSFGDDEVLITGLVALGHRAVFGRRAVGSVTQNASMAKTCARLLRWLQIRWTMTPLISSLYESIMSPMIPAAVLLAALPSKRHLLPLAATAILQVVGDLYVFWRMRNELPPARHLPLVLARPFINIVLWLRASVDRRVSWRGMPYLMGPGATVLPYHPEPETAPAFSAPGAGQVGSAESPDARSEADKGATR